MKYNDLQKLKANIANIKRLLPLSNPLIEGGSLLNAMGKVLNLLPKNVLSFSVPLKEGYEFAISRSDKHLSDIWRLDYVENTFLKNQEEEIS